MLSTNRLALLESSLSPYCYQCYYLAYHLCQLMRTYVRDGVHETHSKEAIDAKEIVLVDFSLCAIWNTRMKTFRKSQQEVMALKTTVGSNVK